MHTEKAINVMWPDSEIIFEHFVNDIIMLKSRICLNKYKAHIL